MYMGELLLVGSLTVHLITIKHSCSKGWMRMTDLYYTHVCSPFFQHQITNYNVTDTDASTNNLLYKH